MELHKRQQYIFRNLAYWILLLVAAISLLTVLRQYNTTRTERRVVEEWIGKAIAYHRQDTLMDCERALNNALDKDPSAGNAVMDAFGARLLTFPGVRARLDTLASETPSPLSSLTQAKLALLRPLEPGMTVSPDVLAMVDAAGHDGELLLGRLSASMGNFAAARGFFETYWNAEPGRRDRVADAILRGRRSSPVSLVEAGRWLFRDGLWAEAFEAFDNARRRGAKGPELRYYDGVKAELDNQMGAALAAYRDVLAQAPRHRMALMRLQALSPTQP